MELEEIRKKSIELRKIIIEMITAAGSGHPGGSLSSIDILTYLYLKRLNLKPEDPAWEERDRFVLSKGHAAPALYTVLAERGFFDKKHLNTLRQVGSILQGHPDKILTPGIDMSTGSLGQGLSTACGMALTGKIIDKKDYKVFAIIGDGESQEGQIWEAAMSAAHYKLNNLCVFLDYNKQQIDGNVNDIMSIEPLKDKWKAFSWDVLEIDGHDFEEIDKAVKYFDENKNKEKPLMIIANTIKGKGISFTEANLHFHGNPLTKEELEKALEELKV